GGADGDRSAVTPGSAVPAVADPVAVALSPAPGSTGVPPVGAVSASATGGDLDRVSLVNDAGVAIAGTMAPDRRSWTPAVPLGYGRSYTLTATGSGADSPAAQQKTTFTVVNPSAQAAVELQTTSGAALREGATYGVGLVVVATFDRAVGDRAAAERSLHVETHPQVAGSWFWLDDHTAHWRPEHYWTPGTAVTVRADVYGMDLGEGTYGAADSAVRFTIGDAHVSIADDTTKQIQVFDNGQLVRTMATSMGKGGTQTIGGTTLAFWTQPGIYTVLDKSDSVVMDSSTYGLPLSMGYKVTVSNAVRLTHSGIYLHQLDSTVWAQGNTNVSHGCLNLNADNASWFYQFSQPGDVVEVRNTGGEPLSVWQNGDWSVPWDTWQRGSALS
ncbi:hypothetical protein EB73_21705, partial [Mycobacterium sp. SWH-M3]